MTERCYFISQRSCQQQQFFFYDDESEFFLSFSVKVNFLVGFFFGVRSSLRSARGGPPATRTETPRPIRSS